MKLVNIFPSWSITNIYWSNFFFWMVYKSKLSHFWNSYSARFLAAKLAANLKSFSVLTFFIVVNHCNRIRLHSDKKIWDLFIELLYWVRKQLRLTSRILNQSRCFSSTKVNLSFSTPAVSVAPTIGGTG